MRGSPPGRDSGGMVDDIFATGSCVSDEEVGRLWVTLTPLLACDNKAPLRSIVGNASKVGEDTVI